MAGAENKIDPDDDEVDLKKYYNASLQAQWKSIRASVPGDTDPDLVAEIDSELSHYLETWEDIYRVERLIVGALPSEHIDIQGQKRLAQAADLKLTTLDVHQKAWDNVMANVGGKEPDKDKQNQKRLARKRAILSDLLDEIDWHHTNQRLDRAARNKAARSLWFYGGVVLFIAALPWIFLSGTGIAFGVANWWLETDWSPFTARDSGRQLIKHLIFFGPLFGLYTALTFGLLGALFSMLNTFQTKTAGQDYYEITAAFRTRMLLVRFGAGMVGALVLYYVMAGGLLQGDLFPTFKKLNFDKVDLKLLGLKISSPIPNADFAKLAVWSFVGGFSERFVPATLARVEKTSEPSPKPPPSGGAS
ncbi:MAG: hypothetical protein AAF441_18265 [Pseudomonadota bacterium]